MSSRWINILQQRQANLAKTDVTCQKCLQKGHWTYECKNPRKYLQRTSRSHQLNKAVKQAEKRKLGMEYKQFKKQKRSSSLSSATSDSSSSSSSSDSSSSEDSGSEDSSSDSSSSSNDEGNSSSSTSSSSSSSS